MIFFFVHGRTVLGSHVNEPSNGNYNSNNNDDNTHNNNNSNNNKCNNNDCCERSWPQVLLSCAVYKRCDGV